jgi:class 3 adenylate cyclase
MSAIPKILIAEDETIIAKDIERTLIKLGYEVVGSVRSGETLLEQYTSINPDLILMDINLEGGLSGIEVSREIQKKSEIPVIYLTAFADDRTLDEAKITEPFGFIIKPFDEDTLRTSIEMGIYKNEISRKLKERTRELEDERIKSERLLKDILPSEIVDEFKKYGKVIPRHYKSVTIIFTDFENFTTIAAQMEPGELVTEINEIFMNFDMIIDKYGLEKLKTIGDSYMIASGVPQEKEDHAEKAVDAAFDMLQYLSNRNKYSSKKWKMRIGIHSGEVIAGVVGKLKYTYDVWGQTVSVASYLERSGIPGKVNISQSVKELLNDNYSVDDGKEFKLGNKRLKSYFVTKNSIKVAS